MQPSIKSKLSKYSYDDSKGFISLDLNEFAYEHAPEVLKVLQTASSTDISKYNTNIGLHNQLLGSISGYTGVAPSNIILINSGDECIKLICDTYLNSRSSTLVLAPTYRQYERFSLMNDVKIFSVVDLEADLKHFDDALRNSNEFERTALFICSPNNPTGGVTLCAKIIELADKYPEAILVIDQTYIDYEILLGGPTPNYDDLLLRKNIFIIRSFSKAFGMAGMRFGYILSHAENMEVLNSVYNHKNIPNIVKACAAAIINNIHHYTGCALQMQAQKKRLIYHLNQIGIKTIDTPCNFILINLENTSQFVDFLRSQRILIRDISSSIKDTSRVTIGTEDQITKLINAINLYLA